MPDTLHKRKKLGKCKLLRASWRHQTKEFFENSTLHGVRYIAEEDRPSYENFMWFIFVAMSTIVTLIIIVSLWEKFQTNPTITGLDTDFHNWDVPFPGITVCPFKPASSEKIEEYVKGKWGEDLDEEKFKYYFGFINLLSNLSYENLNEIAAYKNDKTLPQDNFRSILFEVVDHCDELLYDCIWKGENVDCCTYFLPTFTEQGFCYSFNTLHAETDWPWKDTKDKIEIKTHYIYETDTKWTMELDGEANGTSNPFNIFIHSSDELPGIEMSPQHVWGKDIDKMFFSAKTTYTTEDARQLSAKQRKCIFEDEVKLKTSPKYSYWACMTNCRMEAALEECGCVPHFYHDVAGFPYCNLEGLVCLSSHASDLKNSLNCPCELGCMNTVYEVEKLNNAADPGYDPLEIGFVSWPMIRYKREVLFGWVDLFVAFGGIAGLFLGFSLLSGVEIIYYFTMRAFCMAYQDPETLVRQEEAAEAKLIYDVDLSLNLKTSSGKSSNAPFKISKKKDYLNVPFLN